MRTQVMLPATIALALPLVSILFPAQAEPLLLDNNSPRDPLVVAQAATPQAANPTAVQPSSPGAPQAAPSPRTGPVKLRYKPSGFWTSNRPAVGGAYRYRLLAIGLVVLLLMGALTIWVIMRQGRRKAQTPWST